MCFRLSDKPVYLYYNLLNIYINFKLSIFIFAYRIYRVNSSTSRKIIEIMKDIAITFIGLKKL